MMKFAMTVLAYVNAGCAAWMVSAQEYGTATFSALVAVLVMIQAVGNRAEDRP